MSDLAELADQTTFPGRVRQFVAPDPGQALALAVGCAWCEASRGGHAVAVLPPGQDSAPLVRAGRDLAGRLGLSNLHIHPAVDPGLPIEPLAARERQPVHLASLGRGLLPTWPAGDARAALGWLVEREPRLLLPDRDPRWGCDPATLLALAWIAGDGWRVVWEAPAGGWPAELALIGQMQLPLKLICPVGSIPWPPGERGLARWWVAAGGGDEAAAVLAWALAGEECCLLALDAPPVPGWPSSSAWTPGAARLLAAGGPATLVCTAGEAVPALAAAGTAGCAVLQLTGLVPLPLSALRRAAATGPLLVLGEDLARHLAPLAGMDPGLRFQLVAASPAAAAEAAARAARHPDPAG